MIKMMKKLFAGMNNFDFDFDFNDMMLVVVMSFLRRNIVLISSYSRSKLPWYWPAVLPLAPAPLGIMQRSRRKLFYY
jgi:hypothetical protein